jgi:methylmalonyl-CoA mutase
VETDDKGGFLSALKSGFIQKNINETAGIRRSDVSKKREILLGTNQHPNLKETISSSVDYNRIFPSSPDKTENIVEPVRIFRGSEEFEKLRISLPEEFKVMFGSDNESELM